MEGQNNNELQKSSPSQSTILSRPIFNELQMEKLRHHFATESFPSEDLKNNLAMEFECSIEAITKWFSKRRYHDARKRRKRLAKNQIAQQELKQGGENEVVVKHEIPVNSR